MNGAIRLRSVIRCGASALAVAVMFGANCSEDGLHLAVALAQQPAGSVGGTVTDQDSGVALEGARVTVVEAGRRTTTGRAGDFQISDLAPGDYTLRIEYLGLPTQTTKVSVSAGASATADVQLGGSENAEIVVTGIVTDTTKKLNQERAADALTEIAASSTSAEFPDRNLGEVLQRLTGVFIDRNGTGEGNVLLVRAINSANNLILVEGQRLPSGRPDGRTPNLATINSDVIESVEVRKVLTPEIPGDFFGGYVNVKQSSAFDRAGPFLSASLETGYRSIETRGADFEASLRASDRFFGDTLGIAVALGVDRRDATFQQYNATRSPNATGPIAATLPTVFQFRQVEGRITRYSGNVTLEYRPNDSARYYAKAFLNYGKEAIDDQRVNVLFGGALSAGSNAVTGGYAAVIPELETIPTERPERFSNYIVGGENEFGDWGVSYSLGYNQIDADQDKAVRFAARSPVARPGGVQYDFGDAERPVVTLGNPALLTTLGTFGATIARATNLVQTDEDQYIGQINVLRRFDLAGDSSFELRFGGRYDERNRASNVGGLQNYPTTALTMDAVVPGRTDIFRGAFDLPLILDSGLLLDGFDIPSLDRPPGDPNFLPSIAGDFSGSEKIYSGYAMGTFETGGLRLIGGVRYERTDLSGINVAIDRTRLVPSDPDPLDDDPSDGVSRRSLSSGYSKWLPALVARYEPFDNLLLRFAISKTYARPTLAQLFTGEVVNPGPAGTSDRAVTRGNAALAPQNSWNFDASIDLYGGNASVFRLGWFYKDISNVFFTAALTEPNAAGGTDFITQPQNGGDAHVLGVEAGLIQGLTFLPSPFDKLNVEINAGLGWSRQQVLGANGAVIRKTDLEGSYHFIGNASLIYRDDWGRARVAYRRSGKRLNAIDINPSGGFNDGFRAPSEGLDADISFNITDRVSVYVEGRNLLKQLEVVEYIGSNRNAITRAQYSGWSVGGGVTVRFF